MKFAYIIVLLIFTISISSCISKKQLTYLQENKNTIDSLLPIQKKANPYRLRVNDVISIRTKALDPEFIDIFNPVGNNDPNATDEDRLYYDGFTVNRHGNIRVPILGEINVLGYTVEEVRVKIEELLLKDYYKDQANIFVTVKLGGIRYTINGEIGSPGTRIEPRNELTLMEAIANSGDITLEGDRKNVVIIRQYPLGQKVHHVDLTSIDAMQSPYYFVQPNDLILINPLPQKTIGTGRTGLESFRTILTVITALSTTILLFTRL
ncbi:polysaccharide biosynthesis/export family protein [Patiriisocius hiemis]|uniref:Polysaccharide biosynthesis/export family protein n=1 Tax=Patiriisocius hiemis TaxID=3075604 RepID=A0ABU2YCV2_9FLAO|nr:polysaccharide biosynthesis/export family protein [Constantimarinum sp. W242]MDT0556009.1 polysaccharide biosynthesis/export family protein [Constantimarinum sp. W242]